MNYKTLTASLIWISVLLILIVSSCSKSTSITGIDAQMYNIAKDTTGFKWYKNSDSLLATSTGSGHAFSYFRARFNVVAALSLDAQGKVNTSTTFQDGAMVVGEYYDANKVFQRYAIQYKQTGNEDADAKGWIWGDINADKTVAEPASNKGTGCISCHGQANNIDYTLMNLKFP
ncbi:MAG: cytochrome P460 family protein [Bacteroidetes bacterium]|nr:cytochrome P460 family protein [Bacteroidota bacterium]